jgi:hypothetical protein
VRVERAESEVSGWGVHASSIKQDVDRDAQPCIKLQAHSSAHRIDAPTASMRTPFGVVPLLDLLEELNTERNRVRTDTITSKVCSTLHVRASMCMCVRARAFTWFGQRTVTWGRQEMSGFTDRQI